MQNGEVGEIKMSVDEPSWSVNIKKALVSLLKIRTPGTPGLSDNKLGADVRPNQWKIMEQGVDGKCENTYQVTELPEYMQQEVEIAGEPLNLHECQGKKIFEVLKTRDVNKCTERTSFITSQPGKYLCPTGNCETMWQRSSITRYIACGTSEANMNLHAIVNIGELNQSLLGYNTEKVVTGTKQVMKLVNIAPLYSTLLPQISSPKRMNGLSFHYTQEHPSMNRKSYQQELQHQSLTSPGLIENVLSRLSPATLENKIIVRVVEVVRSLNTIEEFEKKQVAGNVMAISKAFTLLTTAQMKSLYEEVNEIRMNEEERKVARQVILESAVISGFNPVVMFLKELIESEKITPFRAGVTIATLPHYIQTPTINLLDQLFELIKSPAVTRIEHLKLNAELAFATLVNRACIDSNRYTRFPIFVYGEFCNSQTSQLTTAYIPYLVSQLHESRNDAERNAALLSLGTLGHEAVIPILIPYVEGKTSESTPEQQRMAIYSLGARHSKILLPVYSVLVHNPSEDRNVRIAALSMMIIMKPSMVHFQRLAASTWFEEDTEFQKYVFSTLKSLSEIKMSQHPNPNTVLYDLSQIAKVVLPLAKPVPITISSTLNFFTAEWLRDLQVGYHVHGAYTFGNGNLNEVYGRLEYFLENLNFVPVEFAINLQGTGKLIEKINQVFGTVSEDPLKNIHPEWRDIISSLDIKNIESSPFGAGLWAKLFDDVQVVYGLNNKNIEPMLRSLKEVMDEPQNLMEKFCGKHPINIVKVNNWANTGISIPSDIGLPIYMEVQMPSVLALRGEVEIDCSGPLPSVSVELGIKADTAFNGYVGTVCPFTMQIVAAGIHQQWSVNYPTMVSAKIEAGKLLVKFSQNKDVKPSTTAIDVMSYSVRPYATIKPIVYDDITPVISHKNTKIIKSQSERKTKSLSTFGQLYGVDTKVVINTETDIADTKNLLDSLSLYKYNPVNMVLFSWTSTAVASNGMPSARFHQIEMVYNPSTSSTKEIEIDLTVAMAHKYKSKGIKSVGLAGLKGKSLLLYQELQGSVSQEHQKLKQVFEKIQVDSGLGFTSALTIVLKGDQERTFSYVVSAGQGLQESKQKWNLHLENKGGMSVCVDGSMILPSTAIRDIEKLESNNIEFNYSNVVGFGQTCQEHTIKVSGRANVSEEQKERIHQTVHKCIISSEKANKIRKEVHDARIGSQEQQELETHQSHVLQKKIKQCEEAFKLMSTLDQAKFTIEYTPMPELVRIHAGYLNTAIKAVLFPYVVKSNRSSTQHNTIEVDLQFKTHLETVDMTLMDEDGSTIYANIRLPERIQRVLPLIASQSLEKQVMEKTLGGPMFPKCYIGDAAVITFDNKTYSYELDDCYHVLVADCSPEHTHSILGKVVDQKTHLQVFNHRSLTTMEPASSYSSSRKEYRIVVDGQPIVLRVNQKEMVQSRDGESTFYLHRYLHNLVHYFLHKLIVCIIFRTMFTTLFLGLMIMQLSWRLNTTESFMMDFLLRLKV